MRVLEVPPGHHTFFFGSMLCVHVQYISPANVVPICDNISLPLSHRDAVISTFVFVHQTLHQANARVARRGGRTMAITPRHYLDFINHYVSAFCLYLSADT